MVSKSTSKKVAKKAAVKKQAKRLGRGLSSLLGDDIAIAEVIRGDAAGEKTTKAAATESQATESTKAQAPNTLSLSKLKAGKYQPRTRMEEDKLAELADSIAREGIMQPILVRLIDKEAKQYEIIAGERQRAAKMAGLSGSTVLVRDVSDEQAAVIMALIENMQREDLNSLEEAKGIERLIREFDFTHEQAAESIGRSRSYTSNLLRLLNLSEPVQNLLLEDHIDMGHARALLALSAAEQILGRQSDHARC